MLFHVRMDVNLPHDLEPAAAAAILAEEKAYSQALQQRGQWRHLWRVAGEYANYSIFDVASIDELHQLLAGLPLFKFMTIKVTPLLRHPSSIRENDT